MTQVLEIPGRKFKTIITNVKGSTGRGREHARSDR